MEAVKKHRFTVEEYHKMGEAGILSEDDRVELIGGEVVEMAAISRAGQGERVVSPTVPDLAFDVAEALPPGE